MLGLMMKKELLIADLIQHAERNHADTEIVSRLTEGGIGRTTWAATARRARQLAQALQRLGVQAGSAVGTLAWNNARHVELYFAIPGSGAVMHTINPRLFPEQLIYIINQAQDQYIFVDLTFAPLIEKLHPHLSAPRGYVLLCDRATMPSHSAVNWLCYEELLAAENGDYAWPEFDENSASGLCFTSGTTGHPKGVLYSHRSTILHTFSVALPDSLNVSALSTLLPVVPMFHVNAWGLIYAAAMCGAKLVLPGPRLDGESLYELYESEQVTQTAGVPTIWQGLLNYLQASGKTLSSLKTLTIGGSAATEAMIAAFEDGHGIEVLHAWGMTETSPLGTANQAKRKHFELSPAQQRKLKLRQGRAVYGVQIDILDDANNPLPHDGKSVGELVARGPWIASHYSNSDTSPLRNGWFATGDVATIDPDGYMQITDRAKDLIKSGGEWISSLDLENAAMSFAGVQACAVIAAKHPKWDERPLMLIVPTQGQSIDTAKLLEHLETLVAKWWLPDSILSVTELPLGATGKINKLKLRAEYGDYLNPVQQSS